MAASLLLPFTVGLSLPGAARAAPSPSFEFAPALPLTLETVTFTSTSQGVVEPQAWDLDGDNVCDDATGPSVQRSFPAAGVYSVKLCVTDGIDDATVTRKVTVLNQAPAAGFTFAPVEPLTGDLIVLTSTAVDADGPIEGQAWDLDGDGTFDDGGEAAASVSFTTAGTHLVRLLVVDREGATAVAAAAIAVRQRPLELLASFPIVRLAGRVTRRGTRVRALTVTAPAGSTVRIRCRGRGCPFRQIAKSARLLTVHRLKRRLLRPGAVLQIWVQSVDRIGKYTRFRIRRSKPPNRADRCVGPGARLPIRCPGATARAASRRSPS